MVAAGSVAAAATARPTALAVLVAKAMAEATAKFNAFLEPKGAKIDPHSYALWSLGYGQNW